MLDVPDQSDIVVTLTPATLAQLVGVAVETIKGANGGFALNETGELVLSGDGWVVRIAESKALLSAAGMSPERLIDALNDDPAVLVSLVDKAGLVPLAELDDAFQSGFMAAVTTPTGQADSIGSNSAGAIDDGLYKRADSNDGTLLSHLDPLAAASPYFTVSVQLTTFANLFGRVNAGVGPDIAHLPPLPDENYLNGIDPTVFTVIDPVDGAVQRPSTVLDLFSGNEDTIISGDLAENDTLPNAGAVFAVGDLMPENGTLVLDSDGTFTFTPDENFSGTVTFEYTVTDPASGTVTVELVDIVIVPVADAPAVTALSTTTQEDTPVALSGLSADLVDQDGSETIAVTISGVPPGASLSAGTEISPGVWSVDPADVPGLVFTPPADWHGTVDLVITATALETGNGDTAVTTVPFSIEVDAQADTPSVTGGSSATDEDTPVTFGDQITYAPTDTDGSEAVTEVQITGVPTGASVTYTASNGATVTAITGGFSVTGSEAAIRDTLDTFAITPPDDSGDDFDLTVAVTVTDADGSMATQTATHPIDVTPVADAPVPIVADASGDEDTPIALSGLGGTLVDTDGSETLTYRIEGLPTGAVLSAGTVQSDGSVLLTPAELAGLTITPPLHFHGTIPLTLVVVSTEGENADAAETSALFDVVVAAVADAPTVSAASSPVNEDVAGVFGTDIVYGLVDADGSEVVSQVDVTGVPTGAAIAYTAAGTAVVTAIAGGFSITGPEADIRATLDTFTYESAPDDDSNVTLSVAVTVTDDGVDTATSTGSHELLVAAVADAPSGSGSGSGDEDTAIAVPVTTALSDTDGSETITQAVVMAPAGVVLGGFTGSGATVVQVGQDWTITGTPAQIDAALGAMTATPPADSNADFNLSVTLTSTETSSNGGEIDTLSADATFTVPVTVNAVADTPTVAASDASGDEDTPIPLNGLGGALSDTDGSEMLSYRIEGLPAGAVLSAGTVQPGGIVLLTPAELAGLTITPPANFQGTIPLTLVSIATEGANSDTAENSTPFNVVVGAVADPPTVSSASSPVNEDVAGVFGTDIVYALVDTDGSEVISQVDVTGVPAGAAITYTAAGGATVTPIAGGFSITGSEADIRATLDTFAYTSAPDDDSNVTLSVAVTATDTGGDTATTTGSHELLVAAVADAPTGSGSGTGDEDTAISVPVTTALSDMDGSETITQAVVTAPAGVVLGGFGPSGATVVQSGQDWTITGTPAQIDAALAAMTGTPPADSDDDFNLSVTLTSTETSPNGGEIDTLSADTTFLVPVTVVAVADAPVPIVANASGDEDTLIVLSGLDGTLVDTDGSEALTYRIEGLPVGSSLSAGIVQPDGSVLLTQAQLAGLTITPPLHFHGTIPLTLVVISTEGGNADTAETSAPFNVVVAAVADAPTVSSASSTVNEDVAGVFGTDIVYGLVDTDGSEVISQVDVTGVPAGAAITYTAAGAAVVTAIAGGFSITGSEADIRATLDTFTYESAPDDDSNVTLSVAVTTTDDGIDTATTTNSHELLVAAVADAPSGSGAGTGDEDTAISVPVVATLSDTDGSETITQAVVTAPTGVVLGGFGPSGATVVQSGQDWTITGTPAQIDAALAAMTATPPADSDDDFNLSVILTSTETSPNGGEIDTLSADTTFAVPVTVNAVADTPTVAASDASGDEDTAIPLTGLGGALADTDGSETLSYRIEGLPAGAVLSAGTVQPGGIVVLTPAELAGLTITPPLNFQGTIPLTLVSIATEGVNSDTAENSTPFNVVVGAVADPPTVSSASSPVNEDVAGVFGTDIVYGLVDTDGSEVISQVDVTGVPAGAAITYTAAGAAVVTAIAGGFSITGSEADIRATLDTFAYITAPDDDSNVTLSVAVTTTDDGVDTATTTGSHELLVAAVADAPTGSGVGTGTGDEDTAILVPVFTALSDTDGSETITQAVVTAPAGVVLGGFGPSGATVVQSGQDWTITGTPAQIDAALAAMTATPPADSDVDFNLSVTLTSTETSPNGGEIDTLSADTTFLVPVTVNAVADTPTVAASDASGDEDTPIPLTGLGGALTDIDGSETLSYRIEGLPTGAVLSAGSVQSDGSVLLTSAQLAGLTITPPANFHGTIPLALVSIATEGANADTAENSAPFNVVVNAQADTPSVVGGASATDEDTAVTFGSQITYGPTDTDGSEFVREVAITGVPAGANVTFTAAGGATVTPIAGGFSIIGSEADIRATLDTFAITPPANSGDDIDLTIAVTVTDADSSTATQTATHTVDVTPVADAPTVSAASSTVNEDVAGVFGTDIVYGLVDTDGSEVISQVDVTGVPAGAAITYTAAGAAVVTAIAGGFSITGSEADIRATLDTFAYTTAPDDDSNVTLSVAVTTTDDGVDTATTSSTHELLVAAVADAPTGSGAGVASGDEDTAISIPVITALSDTDGSETITQAVVTAPAGVVLGGFTGSGATVVQSGQDWAITGTSAQIDAALAAMTATPPADSDVDFNLSVTLTSTETSPNGGEVDTLSADTTFLVPVTVNAVADAPTVSAASSTVNEDVAGVFGTDIVYGLVDTDGSEVISQVDVTGVPAGAAITYTAAGAAVVTAIAGGFSIIGSEADIRATLDTFAYTTTPDDDSNVTLSVAVTTTDDGVDTATTTSSHELLVAAVADAPTGSGAGTGDEDTAISVPVVATLSDTDGSETITQAVVTAPAGVVLGGFGSSGATVVQSGQDWTITGTPTEINLALANMTATPPADSDVDFNLSVTLTSTETSPVGGEIDTLSADTTFAVPVTVVAVADTPSVMVGPGLFNTEEDTAVALSGLDGALSDTDGSETLSYRIEGLPAGAVLSAGTVQPGGIVLLTPAELATVTFTPPLNFHGTIPLTLVSIATEGANADTAENSALFNIVIGAQADTPSVVGGSSATDEDTAVTFGSQITYGPTDTDGSEAVTEVQITDVPTGANVTFTATGGAIVTAITGGFSVTGPEADIRATLDTFAITPPDDSGDDIDLTVAVTVTDADSSTATQTATHTVDVTPVADVPDVTGGNYTTDEDTNVALVGLAGALNDLDGSETLTHRITGVDPAASFTTGTDLGGGVWGFTAAELAAGLTYSPPPQADGTFTMVLESIATEDEGDVAVSTANVEVIVNPILDVPNLANGSSSENEDTIIPLGSDISLSIDDLDGSQTLTIVLNGIPATATTDWNMTLPGSVTQTGAQEWTISGTAAQASALLDSFTVLPQTHDDANFSVAVAVTTVENGGATTTVNATHDVTVAAVADAPNLSLISAPQGDEDTVIDVPIAVSLVDTDGTETLDYVEISGVPAGATLTIVTSGSAVATDLGGGVWRVTGPDADIQATLAGGVSIQPVLHSGDDIPLTVTAQSIESNPTETEVAVPTAQTVIPVVVDVVPVADGISATGGSFTGEEDTAISLAGLDGSGIDTDGSETITFTLSGVPSGASFDSGTNLGSGVWGFTAAQVSAGLVFNPALHVHGTVNMTLTATTTEGENGSSQVSTAPVQIVVDAQADRPNITGTAVGREDTAINFGSAYTVALVDQDGSESITQIVVTMPGSETATFTASGGAAVNVSGQSYTITGSEADIQATLDTFTWTPPLHSDANITVVIAATTLDADGSTATRTRNRTVRVRAAADDPDGTASDVTGVEDMAIALSLVAIDSADTDGSETTSVRLFNLPAGSIVLGDETGGVVYTQSGNDWIVTGPDTATLNASLAGATYTPPLHFSGTVNASMEVISTEGATGNEVVTALASASVVRNFTITVDQEADAPELRVVNATEGGAGLEDTPIRLVVDVRLVDSDGSEQLSDVTITGLPAGAQIVDGAGNPLGALQGDGSVIVTSAQLAQLHVLAPANSNDDFQLTVSATATETNQGLGGDGDTQVGSATIDVDVIGVADGAIASPTPVVSAEDDPIPLGAGVNTVLADTDGSETLFFVIEGLPPGVVPSAGTFIGSGWQVDAADMPGLTIPSPPNFSGDYVADFAPGLQVRAITQENDGGQTSVTVPLDITVTPVVDTPSWNPVTTVNEDNNISLAGAAPPPLSDNDGSEAVVSYTFDFSSIVADAGIGSTVTDTADFIANYITGTFTDNSDGTITVLAANLAGVALLGSAFPDSNRDFSVPVAVEFSDTAGATVVTSTVNDTFDVNLVGVADQPTVFADDYTGNDDTLIAINPTGAEFGGDTTDTDAANGQVPSETLYYVVSGLGQTDEPLLSFVNAAGNPVGFNNQDGTWLFTPADLVGLHVIGVAGEDGTANLTLTSVTNEDDGDTATNATTFTVDITAVSGTGTPVQPLPPVVVVNSMIVDEDGTRILDISVTPDPAEPSPGGVSISVILSGIPADATVTGAFFNPINNTWVTDAATISSGGVSIEPAADYSGPLDFTVTAAAINAQQQQATTSNVPVSIDVTPVADGPAISFSTPAGDEDSAIAVNIGVALRDTNGTINEQVQEPVLITVSGGATLSAGTDIGGGVWELTLAELSGLTVTPASNSGDDISITIQATTVEPANGDTATTTQGGTIPVSDVADAAILGVSNASGDEDTAIALTGLSAALADTDGSEVLSVTLANIPEGSILSAGANNGDGTWTINPADLAGLSITPPANWSGTVNLELVAFTLEPNGDSSQTSAPFTLTVNPVADGLVLTAVPRDGDAGTPIALDLQIAPGDDTGTTPGENPAETLVVVLSGPANFVATSSGGVLEQIASGEWTFTGTTAEANSLAVTPYGATDSFDLGVSVTTVDGSSTGTPVIATVPITVTNPGLDIVGDGTAETLAGGAGADLIAGGGGADVLSGGTGADLFVWQAGDLAGGVVDQITDFDASQDVLDLAALLTAYDPASDVVADFVALAEAGGNTTVSIDQAGGGNHTMDVVELTGVTGLDLATLVASSHITV